LIVKRFQHLLTYDTKLLFGPEMYVAL